ncbi:MAG: sensor histidine kinase [Deltaproteobacteria bacterium]|nr:sensor histidine kinase [Deltaproteobacteria bacterium]
MIAAETTIFFSFAYIGLLFTIAYYGDRRARLGRSITSNPYIYALSLAVYCTAWTFYGSVGRAVTSGPTFLTIYIGPTLMIALGWFVLRKIIRISKKQHITSIADFIASRYGKSQTLGGVVSIIAVIGIIPYISLQLKAISKSFHLMIGRTESLGNVAIFNDSAFYIALILALFSLLFGSRHVDVTERHEGLVAAIAFESVVKLAAFIAVGIFVTYGIHYGIRDLAQQAHAVTRLENLFTLPSMPGAYTNWAFQIFISMMAVLFLPRQFQMAVVENVDERHLNKAIWLFPLYMLAINVFVLPVAISGVLQFPGLPADPDTFVLKLPMVNHKVVLTIFVFLGGMSAATGMVIVATIALSTMICNDLVMPILFRLTFLRLAQRKDLSSILLKIRWGSIVLVLMLGYVYFRFIGEFYPLVSIGLISFVAVAQFAPSIIGGIFWKGATHAGALIGLIAGFCVWAYTLFLPHLTHGGVLPDSFVTHGPFGISLLKPYQLLGLTGIDQIAHSTFWSMFVNIGAYVGVSLFTIPKRIERNQAELFVEVFKGGGSDKDASYWTGTVSLPDLQSLLGRFLGDRRAKEALERYRETSPGMTGDDVSADSGLVIHAERLLAGTIGSASAGIMVRSILKEEPPGIDEVMNIVDETRQFIAYSHELEKTTAELKAANERLQELDRLKDDFISTVTHELKTPLTSVRSLTEILHDHPEIDNDRRQAYLQIIVKESERLTRLITQVLTFQKIDAGGMDWNEDMLNMGQIISDAITASNQLIQERNITLTTNLDAGGAECMTRGDRDGLMQVMVNLISNAVKFCDQQNGTLTIRLEKRRSHMTVSVADNGIGISKEDHAAVFEKFKQVKHSGEARPSGTGLGLAIARKIVEQHRGHIWVESEPGKGATFKFTIPASPLTQG